MSRVSFVEDEDEQILDEILRESATIRGHGHSEGLRRCRQLGGIVYYEAYFGKGPLGLEFYVGSKDEHPVISKATGQAAPLGLKRGDVVRVVGREKIRTRTTEQELENVFRSQGKSRPLRVVFTRDGGDMFNWSSLLACF